MQETNYSEIWYFLLVFFLRGFKGGGVILWFLLIRNKSYLEIKIFISFKHVSIKWSEYPDMSVKSIIWASEKIKRWRKIIVHKISTCL